MGRGIFFFCSFFLFWCGGRDVQAVLKRPLEWHQHHFELTQSSGVRAACSGSIETNPFSCRSAQPCTALAKSAVCSCSEPADLCVCEWLLCCYRDRTKWVQVTALLPLLAHIVSNYSSKHWHSMCGLTFIPTPPSPPMLNRVRKDREKEREQKTDRKNLWKGGKEWWDKEMCLHSLLCASLWCNYKWHCSRACWNASSFSCFCPCEENAVYTQASVPHLSPMPPQIIREQMHHANPCF